MEIKAAHGIRFLHEFFVRAAQDCPDLPAIDVPPGISRKKRCTVSYAELLANSSAIAHSLQPRVSGECIVAIFLRRDSWRLYASQLAVLRSGAAHVCIDPVFPDAQIRDIVSDAGPVAILTDAEGLNRLRNLGLGEPLVVNVCTIRSSTDGHVSELPTPSWLTPSSLAYVIYTSGTTGKPKGVMIEHRSIVNLVQSDLDEFALSPSDRVVQASSPSYDSSMEETWLALAVGATLVIMDEDDARLGPDLVPWLQRERVTVFCPPPTLLRAMGCRHPESELAGVRLLYVGGEALPEDVATRWAAGRRLVNGYGPTECTVTVVRGDIEPGKPITIGRPVPGATAWVLDDSLNEVPVGEKGELCIGGISLARGYHGAPTLTAERFVEHARLGRIYRTGDLAHRETDGSFFYHGRRDAQIKLRGYRIELEAIESALTHQPGVRAAACCVQGANAHEAIVAFVVPADPAAPPAFDVLRKALDAALPDYMVPSRIGLLEKLPTNVSGKLKRDALPIIQPEEKAPAGSFVPPRNPLETKITQALQETLQLHRPVSVAAHFFHDLGGNSLQAARLISLLREDPQTASLTVRDVYQAPTAEGLAALADERVAETWTPEAAVPRAKGHPHLATVIQAMWLLFELMIESVALWFVVFRLLPVLPETLGTGLFILALPVLAGLAAVAWLPLSVGIAVAGKRLLIGTYKPLRAPAWGSFHVRNWLVQRLVRLVPWAMLEGTALQLDVLRLLGARIGQRVHLHRGVDLLEGGWDLLDIGDDVSVGQEASIRLIELDAGQIVVGPVTLGNGSTMEVRAGVSSSTRLEADACLTALSSLPSGGCIPRGEKWSGIPAQPAGQSPEPEIITETGTVMSPRLHGLALGLGRLALSALLALPFVLALSLVEWRSDMASVQSWIGNPDVSLSLCLTVIAAVVVAVPLALWWSAVLSRLLGRVEPGVISRWSLAYVRVWLKGDLLQFAGRWLSGALLWPVWLRRAGMRTHPGCEISTIIDTVPELVEVGRDSFLADGIYLGVPLVHRGTVRLARVSLGSNTFVGNHAVIAAPQQLPDDTLTGVCTVADDTLMRPGSSWFGHPPFELPRREVIHSDRSLTHDPSTLRYLTRVFWEGMRLTIPVLPLLAGIGWLEAVAAAEQAFSSSAFLLVALPVITLSVPVALCLVVLALKWLLLGRVRPGIRSFWSCWCGRWDFLYVAWEFWARDVLTALEGTLLLNIYLRAMGARIGKRVLLGQGNAQVVDPDMLVIEDDATVDCMIQAHTFEDRVLKIDEVRIRAGATASHAAVLLYGADLGEQSRVAAHGVVMKQERLQAGRRYSGCPTRPDYTDCQN